MQLWVLRFKPRYFRFWKMRRERDTHCSARARIPSMVILVQPVTLTDESSLQWVASAIRTASVILTVYQTH
jgi:hypothetical protein